MHDTRMISDFPPRDLRAEVCSLPRGRCRDACQVHNRIPEDLNALCASSLLSGHEVVPHLHTVPSPQH